MNSFSFSICGWLAEYLFRLSRYALKIKSLNDAQRKFKKQKNKVICLHLVNTQ